MQYRASHNRCRRCYLPLAVPVAAPAPAPAATTHRPNVATGVKCWRRMRGLTQKQLAAASQLPRTYISRIENGRITPGLVTLERVAGALRVTLPLLLRPAPDGRNGNGQGNGMGQLPAGGNGNGAGFMPPPGGHGRIHSPGLEAETCLREILRYSGLLSGAQRHQVLCRVRELVSPHLPQ